MTETFKLTNVRFEAEIYPKRGANLIKLYDKKYDADILRNPQNLDDFDNKNPFLYGTPMLIPPNRISDAKFMFDGREYTFPVNEETTGCFVHGEMHKTNFNVIEHTDTYIRLLYKSTKDNLYLNFPHEFDIGVEYVLTDEEISQIVRVKNNSQKRMPFGLGFHTTFNTHFLKSGQDVYLNADAMKEFLRNENFLPTGEQTNTSDCINALQADGINATKNEISTIIELGDNHVVCLKNIDKKIKVNYILDEKYKYLMLFNLQSNGEYICIEPQTWLTNCPNLKNRAEFGFDIIEPQKEKVYKMSISCEKEG